MAAAEEGVAGRQLGPLVLTSLLAARRLDAVDKEEAMAEVVTVAAAKDAAVLEGADLLAVIAANARTHRQRVTHSAQTTARLTVSLEGVAVKKTPVTSALLASP